jgi:hypothetical protein
LGGKVGQGVGVAVSVGKGVCEGVGLGIVGTAVVGSISTVADAAGTNTVSEVVVATWTFSVVIARIVVGAVIVGSVPD